MAMNKPLKAEVEERGSVFIEEFYHPRSAPRNARRFKSFLGWGMATMGKSRLGFRMV